MSLDQDAAQQGPRSWHAAWALLGATTAVLATGDSVAAGLRELAAQCWQPGGLTGGAARAMTLLLRGVGVLAVTVLLGALLGAFLWRRAAGPRDRRLGLLLRGVAAAGLIALVAPAILDLFTTTPAWQVLGLGWRRLLLGACAAFVTLGGIELWATRGAAR